MADGSIDVLEQTPVADIVALGVSNGAIILHNIKTDEQLVEFRHDRAVSAIGFRQEIIKCFNQDISEQMAYLS